MRTVQHLTACLVVLDYEQLLQLANDSPNLSAALEMQPTEGLTCLQAAVHEVGWWVGVRDCARSNLVAIELPQQATMFLKHACDLTNDAMETTPG
jgi:hypothetical protein